MNQQLWFSEFLAAGAIAWRIAALARANSARGFAVVLLLVTAALPANCALAQQVTTEAASTHIFPAGAGRGTRVEVRVGGECLPPRTRLRLSGPGISGPDELGEKLDVPYPASPRRPPGVTHVTYPREWKAWIEVAADAAPGARYWRLTSAKGGTSARPFIVGELPEVIEREPNSTFDQAEPVALPVTLNGQVAGERDLDYFAFAVEPGQVVSAELVACRLGSPLDPVFELQDGSGRPLAAHEARLGGDAVLTCVADRSDTWRLLIANLGVGGGPQYVYRANLTLGAFAEGVFPSGGQRGHSVSLELAALGAVPPSPWSETVALPDTTGQWWFTCGGSAQAISLSIEDLPTGIEQEPNDAANAATNLVSPGVAYGRLDRSIDEDWFRIDAPSATNWSISCRPEPKHSSALPVVTVHSPNGDVLATFKSVDRPGGCGRIEWAGAAGMFFVRVRDLAQAAGTSAQASYRLAVEPATPDFALEISTDSVNVIQAGKVEIDVRVTRQGGFAGPIDLAAVGLPAGVRLENPQVPAGVDAFKLSVAADESAVATDATIQITGSAELMPGEKATRTAHARHAGCDAEGIAVGPTTLDHVALTLRHKPLFRLYCSEAYQYAHRGTLYPYLMEVERLNGFEGPIHLEMGDRQIQDLDGVEIKPLTIPAGQTQIMLPLYLPESMHINVQPHSDIYAQGHVEFTDPGGLRQTWTAISEMRCMIRPLPGVARLECAVGELTAALGERVTCPLRLARTTNFRGPLEVELFSPPASEGFATDPVTIPADQTEAVIHVRMPPNLPPEGIELTFRGTGNLTSQVKVISEARMRVRHRNAP